MEDVWPKDKDRTEAVEIAILQALHRWRETILAEPYEDAGGVARGLDLALVDARYMTDVVYGFVAQSGGSVFRAAMGYGTSRNLKSWRQPRSKSKLVRMLGENWYISKQPSGINLVNHHSDHWKGFAHERFLTPSDHPGSLTLYGTADESRRHMAFSKHITAEELSDEFVRGKGIIRKWVQKRKTNHWLDCTAGCCCAADMLGITLVAPPKAPARARKLPPAARGLSKRPRKSKDEGWFDKQKKNRRGRAVGARSGGRR